MDPTTEEKKELVREHTRFERLQEERRAVSRAVRERMSGAIIGAFGLVAGIAWNDAVRATIDHFYPPSQGGDILPKFLYALAVTVVVSILIYILTKIFTEKEKK